MAESTDPWSIACRNDHHAASEGARIVLDSFVAAGERDFALGLLGGRISPILCQELVRQARLRQCPLAEADFFWTDERCVRPDHEASNYHTAKVSLLDLLGVPPERVHRLQGELPPERGALAACQDWEEWGARRGSRGAVLDCGLLGVGEDGHVASLFPNNLPHDLASTAPFRATVGPKPPPQRLTMGYRLLAAAHRIVIVATGEGKAAIVADSIAGRIDTPLARLLQQRRGRDTIVLTHA